MTTDSGDAPTPQRVHRLEASDFDEAASLMVRAFFDYPMWQWVLPDEVHRRRALPVAMRASLKWGSLLGESYALASQDGPLHGVMIWAPAGMSDVDLDPEDALIRWAEVEEAVGADGMGRFEAMIEAQRPSRLKYLGSDGWYLSWLGVDAGAQRTGAGSALLRDMFARLDPQGIATYLETEKAANVPYYLKHGYEVVHTGVLPDGGPEFWCFLRTPRAA